MAFSNTVHFLKLTMAVAPWYSDSIRHSFIALKCTMVFMWFQGTLKNNIATKKFFKCIFNSIS